MPSAIIKGAPLCAMVIGFAMIVGLIILEGEYPNDYTPGYLLGTFAFGIGAFKLWTEKSKSSIRFR